MFTLSKGFFPRVSFHFFTLIYLDLPDRNFAFNFDVAQNYDISLVHVESSTLSVKHHSETQETPKAYVVVYSGTELAVVYCRRDVKSIPISIVVYIVSFK